MKATPNAAHVVVVKDLQKRPSSMRSGQVSQPTRRFEHAVHNITLRLQQVMLLIKC